MGQIDDIMNRVGRISEHLRLTMVDKIGLQPAVESYAREFSTITRIPCTVRIDIRDLTLQDDISNEIFCVFQEALTNVARHAEATMVDVQLVLADGQFTMQIADNGKGMTRDKIVSRRSAGVAGMRERARRFGGDVRIDGRTSKGTTLTFQIPLSALL
jgi:two-component system sensor histidine kinase UhpB